jgi:hypothetical protein
MPDAALEGEHDAGHLPDVETRAEPFGADRATEEGSDREINPPTRGIQIGNRTPGGENLTMQTARDVELRVSISPPRVQDESPLIVCSIFPRHAANALVNSP